MGYRPTIICGSDRFEYGKFYGYVDHEKLKSIQWLLDHNKIEDIWDDFLGGWDPTIEFTPNEFREFITLYEQDINDYEFDDYLIDAYPKPFKMSDHWDKFNDIFNNNENKIIEWG